MQHVASDITSQFMNMIYLVHIRVGYLMHALSFEPLVDHI